MANRPPRGVARDQSKLYNGNVINNSGEIQREMSFFNNLPQRDRDKELCKAARNGQFRRLQLLIAADPKMDFKYEWTGWNALHRAIIENQHERAQVLLKSGADANARYSWKGGPLHLACYSSEATLEMVSLLLQYGARPSATDDHGRTPIMLLSTRKDDSRVCPILDVLLANGAALESKDKIGRSALHSAAKHGRVELVRCLLDRGADIKAADEKGMMPLHLSAQEGYLKIAEELLARGADVDAVDFENSTPLSWAAGSGHFQTIDLLLKAGANVDAVDDFKRSILTLAAMRGHLDVVCMLLKAGAQVNAVDQYKNSALMCAAANGRRLTMDRLLEAGADVRVKNVEGWTVFDILIAAGHLDVAERIGETGRI